MTERGGNILTVEQVASYARLHPQTVYRLVHRGELPGVKVGRTWRFHRRQIDDWLRRRREPGAVGAAVALLAGARLEDRRLREQLKGSGYQVIVAPDGVEALAQIIEQRPDVAVLDANLPKLSGLEVCRRVRADAQLDGVALILLGEATDRLLMLRSGADDYLDGAVEPADLLFRAELLLRRRRREAQLNPVSRLPGRIVVDQAMEARLFAHEAFDLALVDLNHFKAFNDAYGFAAGDQLVRRTADLLREALAEHAPGQAVLGHAGGDDFLALLPPGPAATICPAVIERFDALVGELAAPGDLARGQVETISRQGSTERHPLVSIAIAVVPYRGEPRVHPARLLQSAAEIRRYLKAQPGSHYLIDRRRPGLPPA